MGKIVAFAFRTFGRRCATPGFVALATHAEAAQLSSIVIDAETGQVV